MAGFVNPNSIYRRQTVSARPTSFNPRIASEYARTALPPTSPMFGVPTSPMLSGVPWRPMLAAPNLAGADMEGGGGRIVNSGGGGGYRGGGLMRPRSGISSAGVAGGIPTSRRGRFELSMQNNPAMSQYDEDTAWQNSEMPAWARPRPDAFASNPRYGGMGSLPSPTFSRDLRPVRRALGGPAPMGQPVIIGDPQEDGKPNPEVVLQTREGLHVFPIKDMPKLGEGTVPTRVRPRVDGREIETRPAPQPVRGLRKFYSDNPTTPTAAQKEMMKAKTHPGTKINFPREPIMKLAAVPKYANGTLNAIDEIAPEMGQIQAPGPRDGEIRMDAQGNEWRYDAELGRGVPVNPYLNSNAPSPRDSFRTSAGARYDDLAQRLGALRAEGLAEGRERVRAVQAQQAQEQAERDAFLATGKPLATADGGGTGFQTPYGKAIVGGTRPKSFTVERMDGSQGQYADVASANTEAVADAAQRRAEGYVTPRGVARPKTAVEELIGEIEPSALVQASAPPQFNQPLPVREPLPDDRPGAWAAKSRADMRRRYNLKPTSSKRTGSQQLQEQVGNAVLNAVSSLGYGVREGARPLTKLASNVKTGWDWLTQPR